jgi:outer membrane protein TolC
LQKLQVRNVRFSLDQAKASLAVAQERFKNNAASAGEVGNAKLIVDDASLAVDRVAEDFAHAKRVLLLMAGLPELGDDSVPEEIPKPVYSPDAPGALLQDFGREGLSKTFQAQIYDYQVQQSDLNYKIAKYRLFPRVDLAFGLSEQNQTQVVGAVVTQSPILSDNVALTANWSIFDGFATRGAKLAALASKRAAERNRQNYLDQALEQARYLERQVSFAARAMALAEVRFDMSEASLHQAEDNLKLRVGSQANVDQAMAGFYQWQNVAFSARVDFFSRWSEYLSLLGIDPVLNNLPAHFINNAK